MTHFRFLDWHNGIGLLGARSYLSDSKGEGLALRTLAHRSKSLDEPRSMALAMVGLGPGSGEMRRGS